MSLSSKTGSTFLRLTEVQQPKTTTTLSLVRSLRALSGKTVVNFDSGSSSIHSIFLPRTPPLALISSIAIFSTRFSDFSLMAIVPVSECRMPTLMVDPAAALLHPESMNGASACAAARVKPVLPARFSNWRRFMPEDAGFELSCFNEVPPDIGIDCPSERYGCTGCKQILYQIGNHSSLPRLDPNSRGEVGFPSHL